MYFNVMMAVQVYRFIQNNYDVYIRPYIVFILEVKSVGAERIAFTVTC